MRKGLRAWWHERESWYAAVALANLVLGTSSVLVPLMISKTFSQSVGALGMLSSLVSLVGVVGSLIWGRLSDAAHRRKLFIVASYGAVGVCFLLIAFAPSFSQLLILNMALNFFWVANASVTILVVIENRRQETWEGKIGYLNQIGTLGWVGGLALGTAWMAGLIGSFDENFVIRLLFFVIGVGGLLAAGIAVRYVPRTVPKFTRRKFQGLVLAVGNFLVERARFAPFHLYYRLHPRRVFRALTRPEGFHPGTKRFLASTLMSFMGMGFFSIPLPLLLAEEFSLSSSSVFFAFMAFHAAAVVAYPIASRRIRRKGNRKIHMGAIVFRLVLFLSASLYLGSGTASPPLWLIATVFLVYGLTWSFFQLSGVALVSRLAKSENRGTALGLYNALAGVGWIVAGVGGGVLAEHVSYAAAFGAAAGLLLVSLVILLFVPDPALVRREETVPRDRCARMTVPRSTPAAQG